MKIKELRKKTEGATITQSSRAGTKYICVDSEQEFLIYDFLQDFKAGLKPIVVAHLKLCSHCREKAAKILKVQRYLMPKAADYLHADEVEVTHRRSIPRAKIELRSIADAERGHEEVDCFEPTSFC